MEAKTERGIGGLKMTVRVSEGDNYGPDQRWATLRLEINGLRVTLDEFDTVCRFLALGGQPL